MTKTLAGRTASDECMRSWGSTCVDDSGNDLNFSAVVTDLAKHHSDHALAKNVPTWWPTDTCESVRCEFTSAMGGKFLSAVKVLLVMATLCKKTSFVAVIVWTLVMHVVLLSCLFLCWGQIIMDTGRMLKSYYTLQCKVHCNTDTFILWLIVWHLWFLLDKGSKKGLPIKTRSSLYSACSLCRCCLWQLGMGLPWPFQWSEKPWPSNKFEMFSLMPPLIWWFL